jgi:cytochrome c
VAHASLNLHQPSGYCAVPLIATRTKKAWGRRRRGAKNKDNVMHFSVLEKFGLALLICAWVIYGSNFLGNTLVRVEEHASLAAAPALNEGQMLADTEAHQDVDIAMLLASADPADGEKIFAKCKACHTIEAGGENKVGPNLHNVVGADRASKDGFAYSSALTGLEGTWTYEHLNEFLENPKTYAPGTKMSFAGLSKPEQRAAVITYLRQNTENPPPLPEPKAAAAEPASEKQGEQAAAVPAEAAEPAGDKPAAETAQAAAAGAGIGARLASADAAAGEKVFNKCKACHTIEAGGPNKVGPNLHNALGADIASKESYSYSSAMQGMPGTWTYEELDTYLENPKEVVKGTKMSFAGLKKPEDRANIILFLKQNSENAPPLP